MKPVYKRTMTHIEPKFDPEIAAVYEGMWQKARPLLAQNAPEIDPCRAQKQPDARRGLTLLARLKPNAAHSIMGFVGKLHSIEPEQYYYRFEQLHVTMLSLFTATIEYRPYFDREAEYRAAVQAACSHASRFTLAFEGVTASPGAILIQGFPQSDALARLRDALRTTLTQAGLGAGLDQRYRLRTAHVSAARFAAPLHQPTALVSLLDAYREFSFGASVVDRLELVAHDWYATPENLAVLETYPLA